MANPRDTSKARRKRKNAARRAREDKPYLAYIHEQRCLVCRRWPVHAHHEPSKGMGGGRDWSDRQTLPLCEKHHQGRGGIHDLGAEGFAKAYRLDLEAEMERLQAEFEGRSFTSGDAA